MSEDRLLGWYGPAVLDAAPAAVALELDPSAAPAFTYRDADGRWWRPCPDGRWIYHRDGAWAVGERPERLEGISPPPFLAPTCTTPERDGLPETGPAAATAPEGLVRLVGEIRTAYRAGDLVSVMAELLLSDLMLLDDRGRLWTPGASTDGWYVYEEGAWVPQPGAPDGPFLTGEAAAAVGADAPVRQWAEHGPYLPERITGPWDPPPLPATVEGPAPPPSQPGPAPRPVGALSPPPPPAARPGGTAAPERVDVLGLLAMAAVIASIALPWLPGVFSLDASAAFLWDDTAYTTGTSIGVPVLVAIAAVAAVVLLPPARRFRRPVGLVVGLIGLAWLVTTFRDLFDIYDRSVRLTLGAMFSTDFAAGPWAVLAGGVLLIWRRRQRPHSPR